MKKVILICASLLCSSITMQLGARVESVESYEAFSKKLTTSILVIAYFYTKDKQQTDPLYKQTETMVEQLSQGRDRISDVVRLIKINLDRSALAPIGQQYHIEQTPTFVFFKNGLEVARIEAPQLVRTGNLAALSGQLRTKVQELWGKDISKILERRIREARYEAARAPAVNVGFGFGYPGYWGPYWGYPFWGYPYGPWVYPGFAW